MPEVVKAHLWKFSILKNLCSAGFTPSDLRRAGTVDLLLRSGLVRILLDPSPSQSTCFANLRISAFRRGWSGGVFGGRVCNGRIGLGIPQEMLRRSCLSLSAPGGGPAQAPSFRGRPRCFKIRGWASAPLPSGWPMPWPPPGGVGTRGIKALTRSGISAAAACKIVKQPRQYRPSTDRYAAGRSIKHAAQNMGSGATWGSLR